jgi:hypothetical protein
MGTRRAKRKKLNPERIHITVTQWILIGAVFLGGVAFLAYEARAATREVQELLNSIWGEDDGKDVGKNINEEAGTNPSGTDEGS